MDPTSLAAIASVFGAATFFAAGYLFAPKTSPQEATSDAFEPSASVPGESLLAASSSQPLARLLAVASEHCQAQAMAVFDDEGLLLEGHDPDLSMGASVGTMVSAAQQVRGYARQSGSPRDVVVGNVRIDALPCGGGSTAWLATLAGNRSVGDSDRDILARAVDRLLHATPSPAPSPA